MILKAIVKSKLSYLKLISISSLPISTSIRRVVLTEKVYYVIFTIAPKRKISSILSYGTSNILR